MFDQGAPPDLFAFLLKKLGINLGHLAAGSGGAFVSLSKKKALNFFEKLTIVASGALTAVYLTPPITSLLKLNLQLSMGVAFTVGYVGLKAVDWFWDAIKNQIGANTDNSEHNDQV